MTPIIGVIDSSKVKFTSQLAYDSIDSVFLGSTSNTVTFSSIPQTYAHLELRIYGKSARSGTSDNLIFQFNSDTGNNYAITTVNKVVGSSAGVTANSGSNQNIYLPDAIPAGNQTEIYGYSVSRITDYTRSKWKAFDAYWGWCTAFGQPGFANFNARVGYTTGAWKSTSAINTITITTSGPTFAAGSVFALYGLKQG